MNRQQLEERLEVAETLADIAEYSRARLAHDYNRLSPKDKEEFVYQITCKLKSLLCVLIMDCNDMKLLAVMAVLDATVCDKRLIYDGNVRNMHFEPLEPDK